MKFSTILAASLVAAVSAQADQRSLATLAEKWNLTDPTFAYDSNTFNLTFPVTDFITTGMAQFSLWTAPGCQSDGGTSLTTNTQLWSSTPKLVENEALIAGPSDDSGSFNGRNATIVAAFNPQTVSTSVIYNNTSVDGGPASAEIRFCMRFGLWTTAAMVETPVEVNFLETLVTLTVNLTDGFEIGDITVAPKDRLVRTANQAYEVVGYECNANNFEAVADASRRRNQGEIIHVCVKPEEEAITDGIFMRSVDEFAFTREEGNIRQSAVEDNQAAGNLLTTYSPSDCKGSEVCRFSTILFAQFYATSGTVGGEGTASMQFGNSKQTRRQLRADRDLQAADSAGAAQFDLNFEVAQAEAQTDSGASSMGLAVSLATVAAMAALL